MAIACTDSTGTQPLSVGDDRLASDSIFASQEVETGETIDQGGYGLSASGGDQFARENQTGQGFSSTQQQRDSSGGQFQPSVQDSIGNTEYRADAPTDPDTVQHRASET